MKRGGVFIFVFLRILFFCIFIAIGTVFSGMEGISDLPSEVKKMQGEFEKEISVQPALEESYLKFVLQDAAERISAAAASNESQYFVYVDRNPKKQFVFVCFFDSASKNAFLIGADKASTGIEKRKGYFITPLGVFENTTANVGYRALGTKNTKGWRGLGTKGSRVWDFGWQKTLKNNQAVNIRFLLHATDPVFGEKKLGQIASKGCLRISGKLNKFLDHYGILDKEYNEQKKLEKFFWLLAKNREPAVYAGKYLVVGDSGL